MARLDSDFLERLVMRLGRGRREVSELLDVTVRYPLPLFPPRFVVASRCEPGWMNARRD